MSTSARPDLKRAGQDLSENDAEMDSETGAETGTEIDTEAGFAALTPEELGAQLRAAIVAGGASVPIEIVRRAEYLARRR